MAGRVFRWSSWHPWSTTWSHRGLAARIKKGNRTSQLSSVSGLVNLKTEDLLKKTGLGPTSEMAGSWRISDARGHWHFARASSHETIPSLWDAPGPFANHLHATNYMYCSIEYCETLCPRAGLCHSHQPFGPLCKPSWLVQLWGSVLYSKS